MILGSKPGVGISFTAVWKDGEAPSQPTEDVKAIAGDANGDGEVTVADAVTILQYIGNKDKYNLSEQKKKNADVDGVAGITGTDALMIQKLDAKIITKLPVEE